MKYLPDLRRKGKTHGGPVMLRGDRFHPQFRPGRSAGKEMSPVVKK